MPEVDWAPAQPTLYYPFGDFKNWTGWDQPTAFHVTWGEVVGKLIPHPYCGKECDIKASHLLPHDPTANL